MSSILDHVEQAVPRATVYGAMKGSPVFIGKYYREIFPSSNASEYKYSTGERVIKFIIASPDKTIFNDMRSAYLRFGLSGISNPTAGNTYGVSEPVSNIIERVVIKMNGTVVEDINRFDYLTSFFKRKLLTRQQKNARTREGYDYVSPSYAPLAATGYVATNNNGAAASATNTPNAVTGAILRDIANGLTAAVDVARANALLPGRQLRDANYMAVNGWQQQKAGLCPAGVPNGAQVSQLFTIKLDMSGIFNVQQLLSGYYSPLEVELYLQDPKISTELVTRANDQDVDDIGVLAPRLCIDQVVMSPEYVSAFESALLSNSNAQGIQIPFSTYYSYSTDNQTEDVTFWVRKPVRYLRSVFFGLTLPTPIRGDNYIFYRKKPRAEMDQAITVAESMTSWRVAIGTKTYREIQEPHFDDDVNDLRQQYAESEVFFAKAVGHYNDYTTETDELDPRYKKFAQSMQGLDLEFSPDNDVLASETTLNSNDIRLRIKKSSGVQLDRIMVFLNYQASIALFPGNETRLLVT